MGPFFVITPFEEGDKKHLTFFTSLNKLRYALAFVLLIPLKVNASFIESSMGTAIVNDATATYYNPAALTLLKDPQFIALGSIAYFQSQFTGNLFQNTTASVQSGASTINSFFYLPSLYLGIPATPRVTWGLAIVGNDFNRDLESYSILRYVQSSNKVENIDLVPSLAIKINDFFAVGIGLNFSKAHFIMQPISGLSSLNIPDSQSHNESDGNGWGGDIGILIKPTKSTILGFNYRSAMTYHLIGTSITHSIPELVTYNYHFTYWTPARQVLSAGHFVTPNLGFVATVQYIQWNIFKEITTYNFTTQVGLQPVIIPSAQTPYHFHNTWLVTLGSQYRIKPSWIARIAGSYVESPSQGNYQIDNGDNIILGVSMGYNINKALIIDGSYAHSFVLDQPIHISNVRNTINGINTGKGDSISFKLTLNF